MPSTPKPRKFVAVCDWSIGAQSFVTGDAVPNPSVALTQALRFGDQFVKPASSGNKEKEG